MNQRNPTMKLIASTVVFTFFVTSLGITPNTFAATGVPTPEVSPLTAGTLAIPAELGQVTDTVMGDPRAPAFIHIQSAHGNYQAEKNIEKLLGYIEKNSSVKLMLLEGAANKLQPELFRIFPKHPDFNRKVTDKLMQEGYLTGPESFLIDSANKTEGWGIENLDAYKKDREAFISVVKTEKSAEKFLGSLRVTIDRRFSSKLNKDLLNLVRQEEALGLGTVSFESWIKTLGEGSRKHLKTDLSDAFYQDQYPFLIRYFRLQAIGSKIDREKARREADAFLNELAGHKVSKEILGNFKTLLQTSETDILKTFSRTTDGYSTLRRAFDLAFNKLPKDFSMAQWPNWTLYAQYIILMQEMEGKGLHEETLKLKDKIQTALAKTADEKEYLVASRQLYLLRRLFALELTRAEYEELLLAQRATVNAQSKHSRGGTKSLLGSGEGSAIDVLYQSAMDFYSTAVVREEKMFQNALKKMSEAKQGRAVIVTGGFHAEGLKKLAASKNCSYIQITPRINEFSKRDHEVYLRSILGSGDVETSQMSALLGIVDRAQRVTVTGVAATKDWVRDVRSLVLGLINSEAENSGLKFAFSRSVFGTPAPALAPVMARAEARSVEQKRDAVVLHRGTFAQTLIVTAVVGMMSVSVKAADKLPPATNVAIVQVESQVSSQKISTEENGEQFQKALRDLKATDTSTRLNARNKVADPKNLWGVPVLIAALSDDDYWVRYGAGETLGEMKDPRIVPALIEVLKDKNNKGRVFAVRALGELKDSQAVPDLIKILKDADESIRAEAILSLGKLKDPRAVSVFTEAFNDPSSTVQFEAALGLAGLNDHSVEPYLIKILTSKDKYGLYEFSESEMGLAAQSLAELNPSLAAHILIRALENEVLGLDAKGVIFQALGKTKDPMAVSFLMKVKKEKEATEDWIIYKDAVASGLSMSESPKVTPILIEIIYAKRTVTNIRMSDHSKIIVPLYSESTIRNAITALGKIKDPATFSDLLLVTSIFPEKTGEYASLRKASREALSGFNLKDPALISGLRSRIFSANDYRGGEVLKALGEIIDSVNSTELKIYYHLWKSADELDGYDKIREAEAAAKIDGAKHYASQELGSPIESVREAARRVLKSSGEWGTADELQWQKKEHPVRTFLLAGILALASLFGIRGVVKTVKNRLPSTASAVNEKGTSRSEVRTYEMPVIPQVSGVDTSSLGAKIGTAIHVAANTVSPLLSVSPVYASEVAPEIFSGTIHFQQAAVVPAAFARKWPMLTKIISRFATASAERMVIDQRQGVPDAASVLPLVTFALYNPKAAVVLALIADASEVAAFEKELAALRQKGALPQNFAVRAFANENEFVGAFAGFYNSAAPLGQSVALITDREDSVVTQKIGSRRHLLSVVGAQNPLKQTASTLLAADKLLNESIWSMGYHFVSVEKLGGLEALMAELTSYVAAQAKVLASA